MNPYLTRMLMAERVREYHATAAAWQRRRRFRRLSLHHLPRLAWSTGPSQVCTPSH